MMLTIAAEPKKELFRKTDSCLPSILFAGMLCAQSFGVRSRENRACSEFPVGVDLPAFPQPVYEWVVTTSSTSAFSPTANFLQILMAENDATLETSYVTASSAARQVLANAYKLDENGFGRIAAQEVMLFIEKSLRRNGLTETNQLLELADVSKLSSRSLIGLIRATARLKDRLPAWIVTYRKSRDAVARQGKNPDALFVGLPKLSEPNAAKAS